MGIDWRMGAEWFETCLLDYDPGSNYGNWTYGAGDFFQLQYIFQKMAYATFFVITIIPIFNACIV